MAEWVRDILVVVIASAAVIVVFAFGHYIGWSERGKLKTKEW